MEAKKKESFVGFWLPADVKAKLQVRALKQERSLSSFIRWLLLREVE